MLENFRANLEREHSMALLGTLLVEEDRNPELLERFRSRLVRARRTLLADALKAAIGDGELPPETDIDAIVNMLIGSFYARYVSHGRIPEIGLDGSYGRSGQQRVRQRRRRPAGDRPTLGSIITW